MKRSYIFGIALLSVLFSLSTSTAFADDRKGENLTWKGYQRFDFRVDGRKCYVVTPKKSASGNPWVWRARFPEYHTEVDVLLLKQGFHVAYMNTDGMLASPRALRHWDKFYEFMIKEYGLSKKVALEAVSRGGLFAYRWVANNATNVACIYADVPVCDIKSWPFGQGIGDGNEKIRKILLKQYDFTQEDALAFSENPIDVLAPIAAANVPLLHIVTLNDLIVPPSENTFVLAERYRNLGGDIEIIELKKGQRLRGHQFDHPDPQRVADFIEKHTK